MSKHFINDKIIKPIGHSIKKIIIEEILTCKYFFIMVDSTQDVSVMDQLAICVRYLVNDSIKERLLSLVVCHDSSGIALYNLLENMFMSMGISMKNIVACSFDGAANMKGTYNGLQSHLKNSNPNIIYTHCMAHVLNLVICDSTKTCLEAENLFGLVEQFAVFLSDSHKRIKNNLPLIILILFQKNMA
ncbi:unnamed protein product [Macrosiphum euphorbiae]|uniref:DUF4371 domain-containing protein n=2 Tax=Macrosiphum euphorbiae TaxID=13131 RepID=A0AAV0Y8R8_9HEMI|nr:unnamed protein product [Macrosiphum euphorbiae]